MVLTALEVFQRGFLGSFENVLQAWCHVSEARGYYRMLVPLTQLLHNCCPTNYTVTILV